MTKFNINVETYKNNIETANISLSNFVEEFTKYNSSIENISEIWNDDKSIIYSEFIKENSSKIEEYYTNFFKRLSMANSFLDELKSLLEKNNFSNFDNIKYSKNKIKELISIIDLILSELNDINCIINDLDIPDYYFEKQKLLNTLSSYTTIYNFLSNFKSEILEISQQIETIVSNYKEKKFNLDNHLEISLKDFTYKSNL